MKFLVLLFVILSTSQTEAREFVCGFKPALKSDGTRGTQGTRDAAGKASSTTQDESYYRNRTINPVIVFGKLKDKDDPVNLNALFDREGVANQRADSLLSINHKGSLAHYFSEMSNGALMLAPPSGGIDTNWYESELGEISAYVGEACNRNDYDRNTGSNYRGMPGFVEEVLADADEMINFGERDENGVKVYDRNGDNVVDLVGMFVPPDFTKACGTLGTAYTGSQVEYVTAEGDTVKKVIISTVAYPLGDSDLAGFPLMVGVMAHEYGHVMGLPELYDPNPPKIDYNEDEVVNDLDNAYLSAGIGKWGVMGHGPWGWFRVALDGPTAMSAWSRMKVGWGSPVTVESDMSNVEIRDITSSASSIYKIPISGSEYFLVENRQNTHSEEGVGSYYDDYAPASGLAIWHVDEKVYDEKENPVVDSNNNEFHKFVDLECADGLFSDKGYNPNNIPSSPNSVSGGDNLDYSSIDSYRESYNGNLGDSTDMWNGLADTRLRADTLFTHYTNPSTAGYNDNDQQNIFTGIALRDIRSSSSGVMQMDLYLQYWAGPITSNTTWSGRITVGGDVTIESGVTLTVERGTEVRFLANTDDTGGGKDQTRSELIVKGKLDADAGDITFRSSDDPGTNADWYGIRIVSGGTADLLGATIQNGVHCVQNEGGTLTGLSDANTRWPNCGATIVEAQYAYQASQTTPLFDAVASGTPDNWSSSELTWTDAAPRVWRISRMRPHGGTWSEWGTLEKSSERPAAPPVFYYLHAASAPGTPDNRISDQPPSGWLSSEPEATATQGVWRTERTRPTGETHYHFSAPTQIETEYAYRASQTAPLFDAVASGPPDNWSSSEITWTDAAPRVWRIRRTRLSGGTWSEWGTLEKYSERPVAQPDPFYRQAASQPDPPGNMISSATPTDWLTSNPRATATESVWRTERTRPAGETHYRFSTPIQIETEYAYRLHTSGTTAPAFTASASGVPTDWSSSRQPPTSAYAPYEWEIRRTRPTDGTWSSWGSATVVSTYTETEYAYRLHTSGTTAPTFTASASTVPTGWYSSRQPPTSAYAPYEWEIRRTRPTDGTWSSWGSATVVSRYTERQTAYKRNDSGTTAPAFSSTASGVPYGWSSSQPSATSSNRYVWRISRTRPAGGSWSSWGSATVVSRYTERQSAYKRNDSGTTAPAFSSTASGLPYGWSSSRQTPTSSHRYEWKISRTRPAGGSWSSWGSATVVSKYTERQSAYKRNDSGTTAPAFSSTASGLPYGWSSSQPSATSSNRYVWRISRTRPAGGSWSSWGSATVVSRYTERQSAYKRNTSGTSAPSFSASSSGVPSGWSSSRQSPTSSHRYEWRIRRTRPAGSSWSNWGSATVVSRYTERQYAYRLHTSGTTAPSFSASSSGVPSGWSPTQPSPDPYASYVWRLSRTRPAGGSWSNWGRATVVNTWTAAKGPYRDGLERLGSRYAAEGRPPALGPPARTLPRRTASKYGLMPP